MLLVVQPAGKGLLAQASLWTVAGHLTVALIIHWPSLSSVDTSWHHASLVNEPVPKRQLEHKHSTLKWFKSFQWCFWLRWVLYLLWRLSSRCQAGAQKPRNAASPFHPRLRLTHQSENWKKIWEREKNIVFTRAVFSFASYFRSHQTKGQKRKLQILFERQKKEANNNNNNKKKKAKR